MGQEDGAAFYGVGNACVEFFDGSVGPAYVYQTVWNCQKAVVALRTKSDVKGVCWNKQSSKWQALISVNRKTYHLGLYTTIEQAQIARKQAEARLSDGTFFDWHKEKSDKPKYDDLTGRKFNRLTVLHREHKDGKPHWVCKCDCGNETYVSAINLKTGHVKSCGCLVSEDLDRRRDRDTRVMIWDEYVSASLETQFGGPNK